MLLLEGSALVNGRECQLTSTVLSQPFVVFTNEKQFAAMLTEDVSWDDLTMLEPAKGKAAVQKYFKSFAIAFPDAKTATQASFGIGSWVVEEGMYSGTNTGPLMGARPTKKPVAIHELNLIELDKNEKIVRVISYGNDLEMSSQLAPKPAAKPASGPKPAAPAPKK